MMFAYQSGWAFLVIKTIDLYFTALFCACLYSLIFLEYFISLH